MSSELPSVEILTEKHNIYTDKKQAELKHTIDLKLVGSSYSDFYLQKTEENGVRLPRAPQSSYAFHPTASS